jgi:hypothetical protein
VPSFVRTITPDQWVNLDLVAILRPVRRGLIVDRYHCLAPNGQDLGVVAATILDPLLAEPTPSVTPSPSLAETLHGRA